MPKCPKCGEEIDSLFLYNKWEKKIEITVEPVCYQEIDFYHLESVAPDVECPECQEVIFRDEEEAEQFLKGGNQDGEITSSPGSQVSLPVVSDHGRGQADPE